MLQVDTMVLIIMVVLVTYQVHADPSISTSSPTPCYGDVVTLVCHHPEVASNPGRYFSTGPTWRENGVVITPSTGVYLQADTSEDLTSTTLTITITVDHFRNKSFNYSCLLVLAGENGLPTGEVETSGEITVDPVDQLPTPVNIATFSNSTTAVLTVSFDPPCCNTAQLTVDITTNSSSATTPVVHPVDSTDPTNTTIVITDITKGVCYTASIQSVCEDNNLLEDSGVLVVNFNGPPEVIGTTDSTITLTWNTALRCFESEMFSFVVIWNEIGNGTSTNVTTSSSPYTISGLQPGTSYQISVLVMGESGVISNTTVHNVATLAVAETPTETGDPTTAIAIAVVVLGIILVAVVTAIVLGVARCWKTRVRGDYYPGSSAHDPNPPASSNPFSSRLSGTCCYAEVDFESGNPTPIPPPPVEGVTYAEPVAVGEKESQTLGGETKLKLPTKQQPHHNIEDFRSDVVDALISIGVDYSGAVEIGGVPHFTAKYNGIHFSVTCVYTSSDVTLEFGHILEATQVAGSTKCLLISNQSTIPSECLLTLQDAGCQFVPVSGYGEEGWEDRMIDKVKDVFPNVANNDSESENLLTSEQEDQPSSIQPGTGPALVQYNNSNNTNIVDRRWTMPDEHCVESREETSPRHNDCSTSAFRGPEDEELNIVKNECYVLDNQNVKDILSGVANDDSESEDLPTSEQEMNILSNGGSCTPSFELFAEASRDGESSIGKRENGGGAASFQEPLPRRKGSKDGAQDVEENALTKLRKFISKTCEKVNKAGLLKWAIWGAGLLLIGTLIYCGPGSPGSHLGTKTPESHFGVKTHQPMWELDITCYDRSGNKMEQVPVSQYVIAFSEQDIQDEANLECLLNQLLWMILQKGNMPCRHSTPCLPSADTKTTNHDASLPNIFVQY